MIGAAKNATTEKEYWELFFGTDIITNIVVCSNLYIETIANRYQTALM